MPAHDGFIEFFNVDLPSSSSQLYRYFIIYKPYLVLSQFSYSPSDTAGITIKQTLKDVFDVPRDVYPVGRLDYDSEGLLILTNDTSLNHRLLHPSFSHEREYWVQLDGVISQFALQQLQHGVEIMIDGERHLSKKATAEIFEVAPNVPERVPPIRFRKDIPTSWIKLSLTEGKNRQVRKMTAKVGFPTLRLIRYRINRLNIIDLKPGGIKALSKDDMYRLLF